jgi:D-3-phosphoglycerate dehydrogenase
MNTKPFIIVCDGMEEELFTQLKEKSHFTVHPKSKVTSAELKELLPKANALIIRSATSPNQELLENAKNLKMIIRAGEGTDNIDKKYCAQVGIKVCNTPGANNNSAAEHAIALMLSTLRYVPQANHLMKQGTWEKNAFVGMELSQKTIGIVGMGRIGQIVSKRLSGFEPKILFFDPFFKGDAKLYNATQCHTLNELLAQSDIITIHVPLMDSTKNLFTLKEFKLMKKNAILINASRGKIVNEEDLVIALKEKIIKAAALDVFSTEPIQTPNSLQEIPNLIMTPHLGASTLEAQLRVGEICLQMLDEYFLKNNLLNEVKI